MFKMFSGTKTKRCDGLSRRNFLQVGTLGALGLSLPTLLQQEARAKRAHAPGPWSSSTSEAACRTTTAST
jgi:hypothetical protein